MIRYNFYLHNDQFRYLRKISKGNSSVSELIRTAIKEFIEKNKMEELNVSNSISKKGGDNNGII
jgi:predicted CopG family antitoxin